jgi:hypothetical protein
MPDAIRGMVYLCPLSSLIEKGKIKREAMMSLDESAGKWMRVLTKKQI